MPLVMFPDESTRSIGLSSHRKRGKKGNEEPGHQTNKLLRKIFLPWPQLGDEPLIRRRQQYSGFNNDQWRSGGSDRNGGCGRRIKVRANCGIAQEVDGIKCDGCQSVYAYATIICTSITYTPEWSHSNIWVLLWWRQRYSISNNKMCIINNYYTLERGKEIVLFATHSDYLLVARIKRCDVQETIYELHPTNEQQNFIWIMVRNRKER